MSSALYGLLGRSLGHSFSSRYFTEKFAREGIDAAYENFELEDLEALKSLLNSRPNLRGLNVTIPYKEAIVPLLDSVDEEARAVGAVNCIRIHQGHTKGYNTDVYGFGESIKPFLAHGMEYALVLGTGGAAKAVAYVLTRLGLEVRYASRKPSHPHHLAYDQLDESSMRVFKLIVNATPLGTWPRVAELPPLPYGGIGPEHFLYDLVYNPAETAFMQEAKKRGAATTGGLTMLHLQAARSWDIWQQPPTD